MPQLDPEAGVPAAELVGLGTIREELLEIYLEVYKLHWLPGSSCRRGVGLYPRPAAEKGRGSSSPSST